MSINSEAYQRQERDSVHKKKTLYADRRKNFHGAVSPHTLRRFLLKSFRCVFSKLQKWILLH